MAAPEFRAAKLQWNAEFANVELRGKDPRMIVGAVSLMPEGMQPEYMGRFSVTYAGSSEDCMAVVISKTPYDAYVDRLRGGARTVVACAPLEGGQRVESWNIGITEDGERLGGYGSTEQGYHTAFALPIGVKGLRVWMGRYHLITVSGRTKGKAEHVIDPMPSYGLSVAGYRMDVPTAGVLPGIPRAELSWLCPNIVIVEPPAV